MIVYRVKIQTISFHYKPTFTKIQDYLLIYFSINIFHMNNINYV